MPKKVKPLTYRNMSFVRFWSYVGYLYYASVFSAWMTLLLMTIVTSFDMDVFQELWRFMVSSFLFRNSCFMAYRIGKTAKLSLFIRMLYITPTENLVRREKHTMRKFKKTPSLFFSNLYDNQTFRFNLL